MTEHSRIANVVTRWDESRKTITYKGDGGWEGSEASVRYQFIDHADRVLPRLGYRSHEGSLYYSLDLGPDLNRRWDSRVRFFTRSGVTDLNTLTVDETLRIGPWI